MESLIFALVSLILLVPILIILPLGLKARGKFIVIAVSSLIAIIGLLANYTLLLWQSSFIVVLLAFLVAYILEKRFGSAIFVHITPKKKVSLADNKTVIESRAELVETEQTLPEIIQNQTEENQNNVVTIEQEELKLEPYEEEIVFEKDDTRNKEKVEASNSGDFFMDEDVSFLMNRNTFAEDHHETNTDDHSIHSLEMNYMEEIEKMLETESDIDGWIEGKELKKQESKSIMENKAKDDNTEFEGSNQLDIQVSKNESIPLLEKDVELEELDFDNSNIKISNEQDKNDLEITIAPTWEEDEIQPLHFDDHTDSIHKVDKTKKQEK